MIFILHSGIDERSIGSSLGLPEYSYFFVLKSYRKALEQMGKVLLIRDVEQVDPLYRLLQELNQPCLFISFNPPHKAPVGLECPTCTVFAWEAGSIPTEEWDDDSRNDWRTVFRDHGRAICLSEHTAAIVRKEMGDNYPILALPTPLWESFEDARSHMHVRPVNEGSTLSIQGLIMDSRELALDPDQYTPPDTGKVTWRYRLGVTKQHLLAIYHEAYIDLLPLWLRQPLHRLLRGQPMPTPGATALSGDSATRLTNTTRISGVVYVSVLNPKDGRKNWANILTAFCWAFRDVEDATLILKMSQKDLSTYQPELLDLLKRLSPFSCRVIALHGFLDDSEYQSLIAGCSYYVNASLSEGLCLPLMEFLSCGKPVIAPRHTAMEDYLDDSLGFIIECTQEHSVWPHDERRLFRALRYRPKWKSLVQAYQESYRVAKEDPHRYAELSGNALQRMQAYCSLPPITAKLKSFLSEHVPSTGLTENAAQGNINVSC